MMNYYSVIKRNDLLIHAKINKFQADKNREYIL